MSTSAPSNRAFYRAVVLVVGALSIGILVLALLVSTSGPRVRHVVAQNGGEGEVSGVGQGLTVVFDRPIEGTDFEDAVEFEPEVDHTVSHRDRQLSIAFDQNLLSNTEYALKIHPGLEDALGRRMEREYSYEFATAEPSFTYLERNYGPGTVDRLVQKSPLSQESYALFGADDIKRFARNDSYLAVVLPRADGTDELRVVDLASREERVVEVPHDVRVDDLGFSPVDDQLVLVARAVYRAGIEESERGTYDDRLYRYDVDGERLQPVDTLSDRGNVESVLYSRDGQALLYRTLDGVYYLTGAAPGEASAEPTPVGIYQDSGGFDRTNTKIAFQFGNGLTIYDARAKESQELPDIGDGGRISAPTFLRNSDELVYIWAPYNAQEGETTRIYIANADEGAEELVVESQPSERFFDDPVVSYDDRYVLVETASESSDLDDYTGNRQPEDARLVLYDRLSGEVIDPGTRGIDPVWNR